MTASQQAQSDAPLSVSQAMNMAQHALESVAVRLVGEVSEVNVKSGYKAAYFTVKDTAASLPCMMWNNRYRASGVELMVGQLVELTQVAGLDGFLHHGQRRSTRSSVGIGKQLSGHRPAGHLCREGY